MIDVENVVTAALRAALPGVSVTNVVDLSKEPPPFVLVDIVGGQAVAQLSSLFWQHTVGVTAYATGRREAKTLALAAYAALHSLPTSSQAGSAGWVNTVTDVAAPTEVRDPDKPDRVDQFTATYAVLTRA